MSTLIAELSDLPNAFAFRTKAGRFSGFPMLNVKCPLVFVFARSMMKDSAACALHTVRSCDRIGCLKYEVIGRGLAMSLSLKIR